LILFEKLYFYFTLSLSLIILIEILISTEIDWNGKDWANACDFKSNDLSNVHTAASECGPLCASTLKCSHYTWTTLGEGTCWMKYGTVSKTDAFFTNDYSMVCGINSKVINPLIISMKIN
jgi:hypothetical protein